MKTIRCLSLPLLMSLLTLGVPSVLRIAPAHAAGKHYVCAPCGLPCDSKVFDQPGKCPDCGMKLVEQGSVAAPAGPDTRRKVAILLFNGVQIIDSMGPYELFGAAGFSVYTVGESRDPLTTSMGLTVVPKYAFADAPQPDVLVVPGGGVRGAQNNAALLDYVRKTTAGVKHTMSVCNGSFILASAGLLDGLTATSTYGNVMRLHAEFPKVKVVGDQRYVDNGKIITTAGLSAGMDGALHVISRLEGEKRAREVALNEEYAWSPAGGYVRPPQADRMMPNIDVEKEVGASTDWTEVSSAGDATHWEIVVQGPSTLGAAELIDHLGRALETQAKWAPSTSARTASAAGSNTRSWTFKDLESRAWSGTLTVEPKKGAGGQYTAKLAIARQG